MEDCGKVSIQTRKYPWFKLCHRSGPGIQGMRERRCAVCKRARVFHRAWLTRIAKSARRTARTDRCVTRLSAYRVPGLCARCSVWRERERRRLCNARVGLQRPYGGGTFIYAVVIGASLRPVHLPPVFIYYASPLLPCQ